MLLIYPRPMLSQNWSFASFTCRCQYTPDDWGARGNIQGQECGTGEVLLLKEFMFNCEIK